MPTAIGGTPSRAEGTLPGATRCSASSGMARPPGFLLLLEDSGASPGPPPFALLSAQTALAVPAALRIPVGLPAVQPDSTSPMLGHSRLLGLEPFWLAKGDAERPCSRQHPGYVAPLLRPRHPIQLREELLVVPSPVRRRQRSRGRPDRQAGPPCGRLWSGRSPGMRAHGSSPTGLSQPPLAEVLNARASALRASSMPSVVRL
jgi:hypothetical protein